jgi:Arc/MetJ family transcription regulator
MRFLHIERELLMRTNIEIDDKLINEAMRSSGARTKKAAVEAGLRLLVKTHSQGAVRKLRGKVHWEGDLDESRLDRTQR